MTQENKLVFGLNPELPYAIEEAVNRLRINISFLGKDIRKIMIVSSEPSTFSTKYAMSREDGKEMKGTSHYLSGDVELDDVLMHTDDPAGDIIVNIENVVNPSLLLENSRYEELLNAMAQQYRYVFVDAPPLGLVSDAERIGNICDGVILCVRGGATSKAAVRASIQQLERAGCPLLGIVLNRVSDSKGGYYHKYYGKKYGEGYYYRS